MDERTEEGDLRVNAVRIEDLDVLRGLALFGVAVVNATTIFRVSLFLVLERFHTDPDPASHAVDWVVGLALESKAFAIFSLLFGVGLGIFRERSGMPRLVRRLIVLLAVGLVHMLLVWNGDILTAYALVGLSVLPFLGRKSALWIALAIGAVYGLVPFPDILPHGAEVTQHALDANAAYGSGSWSTVLAFRTFETRRFIVPLLAETAPRIGALFLLGDWAWRRGIFRAPARHLRLLRATCMTGLLLGGGATAVDAYYAWFGLPFGIFVRAATAFANIPLALGYAAGVLLLLQRPAWRRILTRFGPIGRMALTSYLAQSLVFTALFYGGRLFGKLTSAESTVVAVAVYALQVVVSDRWLRRYHFGPFEWAWRALTYGTLPPMRRLPSAK